MTDADETPTLPITTRVINRVEECYKIAEKFYGKKIPRCKVLFNLTGKTAGTACLGKKELRFNIKLAKDNQEHFLDDTVPHEVAHIVQDWYYGYGTAPHGKEWKKVMIEVYHLSPKRCHHYDITKVKRKTKEFRYTCKCEGRNFFVGNIKHSKMKKSPAQYRCPHCLQTLVFAGKGSAGILNAARGLTRELEL